MLTLSVIDTEAPSFPSRCIVCGKECNDSYVTVQANPSGYFGLWKWMLYLNKKLKVPAHKDCGSYLRLNVLYRNLILLAIASFVLIVEIALEINKLPMLVVLTAVISPVIVWQIKNPPPVEFTHEGGRVEFTFKSANYGLEFHRLNIKNSSQN